MSNFRFLSVKFMRILLVALALQLLRYLRPSSLQEDNILAENERHANTYFAMA